MALSGSPPTVDLNVRVHWDTLQEAYSLIRQGKLPQALPLYERVLRKANLVTFYADPQHPSRPLIDPAPEPQFPSFNWLVVMLIEYYMGYHDWSNWMRLFDALQPYMDELHPRCVAYLQSGVGWSAVNDPLYPITDLHTFADQMRSQQLKVIDDPERAAMFDCVIANIYRILREPEPAFLQVQSALKRVNQIQSPYFQAIIRHETGSIYYYLNDLIPNAFEKAEQLYQEAYEIACEVNDGTDFWLYEYSQGWTSGEQGDLETAERLFRRGLNAAIIPYIPVREAMYRYGLSYVLLNTDRYSEAQTHLEQALARLRGISPVFTALSLLFLALIYRQYGHYDMAKQRGLQALHHIQRVNNPLQTMHIYRELTMIAWDSRDWRNIGSVLRYGIRTTWMRLRLRKRIYPF